MTPKTSTEIFSYISHVVFAIIIATSYESATWFMDPEKVVTLSTTAFIHALELLLSYVIIVSGWVGYARSMIRWPHTDTKYGAFRFVLDLAILFCYFSLMSSADPQHSFKEYFVWWILVLFGLFAVWDLMKIKEYDKRSRPTTYGLGNVVSFFSLQKKSAIQKSFKKTLIFFVVFIILQCILLLIYEQQPWIVNHDAAYMITLIVVMALIILYRIWKWFTHTRRRGKKPA